MWSCRSLTRGDYRVPMLHLATGIYKQNVLFIHGEVEVFCCLFVVVVVAAVAVVVVVVVVLS